MTSMVVVMSVLLSSVEVGTARIRGSSFFGIELMTPHRPLGAVDSKSSFYTFMKQRVTLFFTLDGHEASGGTSEVGPSQVETMVVLLVGESVSLSVIGRQVGDFNRSLTSAHVVINLSLAHDALVPDKGRSRMTLLMRSLINVTHSKSMDQCPHPLAKAVGPRVATETVSVKPDTSSTFTKRPTWSVMVRVTSSSLVGIMVSLRKPPSHPLIRTLCSRTSTSVKLPSVSWEQSVTLMTLQVALL